MEPRPKVLIADDEPDCIAFVRQILEDACCEVIEAPDGEKALELIRQHRPQMVILDVQMPKADGFDVFRELRRDPALAAIPVVMLSSINRITELKFSADDLGKFYGCSAPEAFIDKPIEPQRLMALVDRYLKPGA